MVKICSDSYTKSNEELYKSYFEKYPFPLSSFQKHSIQAIVEGNHILITAHTGSGKTLPAEFAIEYTVKVLKKKIIYTSPIKALSNQKFYEFTKKFPDISFGIITGDIKCNPEADCIIMTTEILLNKLYSQQNTNTITSTSINDFNIDINSELGCVVFDEVHYINDLDRGKVWEETIMRLPTHIQMVMLSATIDSPEKFAGWCEQRDKSKSPKSVYLTTTYERVVPLTHYAFITTTKSIFKTIKDKVIHQQINDVSNKLLTMQTSKGVFNEPVYHEMQNVLSIMGKKNVVINKSFAVNQCLKHCVENEILPALVFVFSRKLLENLAKETTTNLLEFDSKVPYIIRNECEQIIRKLPNYKEYLQLPEYLFIVSLLEKGVGIHHAGIMPVLREMVELLYSKGYIKVLFATETFAVGINMPTKTVIFTDIEKYDGSYKRLLYSHEYTQQAGRAGRRGIDTVGNVIHLYNLYNPSITTTEFRGMLKGTPQTLTSKFKISYSFILNSPDLNNITDIANQSMSTQDIELQMGNVYQDIQKQQLVCDSIRSNIHIPFHIIDKYYSAIYSYSSYSQVKNKKVYNELKKEYNITNNDLEMCNKYCNETNKLKDLEKEIDYLKRYRSIQINNVIKLLVKQEFIYKDISNQYYLTQTGKIASLIKEVHSLVFATLIFKKDTDTNPFTSFNSKQLISIFSCFTNITVHNNDINPNSSDDNVNKIIKLIDMLLNFYGGEERDKYIQSGTESTIHYDLVKYTDMWCDATCEEECKLVLSTILYEKEISLGEFVKAILKINNISQEMERVAETIGNMELLSELKKIPILTMKFVVTNQSLYV